MRIIALADGREIPENEFNTDAVFALGTFDGVHLGHRAVIGKAVADAERAGIAGAVWCVNPPSKNADGASMLTTDEEKLLIFKKLGVEYAFFEDFDAVRNMSPSEFVRDYLMPLGCKKVLCGFNFRFGKGASGDSEKLKKLCAENGMESETVKAVTVDGCEVSSSEIRRLIINGEVEKAGSMSGESFFVSGMIKHGRTIGKRLGFPTVNQSFENGKIIPKHGVYFTKTVIDGREYNCVSNVGIRPTVGGHECRLETHIENFDGDLYGRILTVSFCKFHREEMKFDSVEELKKTVDNDRLSAKRYFSGQTDLTVDKQNR